MTDLKTFQIPSKVTGTDDEKILGKKMIDAWKQDGIFQISRTAEEDQIVAQAYEANRKFFSLSSSIKKACVSDITFSGYVAVGEEKKGGDAGDFPEVFTLFEDIAVNDARVQKGLPGHGPVPWPQVDNIEYFKKSFLDYKNVCANLGHRILQLAALGMNWPIDAITQYTKTPWNYMRVLKFPKATVDNKKGIGSHTDYDFLVISTQDEDKQGLYIRHPIKGEKRYKNWLPNESMRGLYEQDDNWNLIKPEKSVFTVFPADMMELITDGKLLSTPHKVALHHEERCSIPVFIGPDFNALLKPHNRPNSDSYHYGAEMIQRYIEMYPDRATTRRILERNSLASLDHGVKQNARQGLKHSFKHSIRHRESDRTRQPQVINAFPKNPSESLKIAQH